MAQIIERDTIDFAAYLEMTEAQQKVRPAKDFRDELFDHLFGDKPDPKAYLPWLKTHKQVQFRPGEVTLWAGINGHGKSLMTGQVALSLMGQGEKLCIASFEMKPRKTLYRMGRQWAGMSPDNEFDTAEMRAQSRQVLDQFMDWTDSKLWLYDQQKTVETKTILGVTKYAADELGCTHIFIDSLMKCVKGEDDYNRQKDFVDELCAIAKDSVCHIHLVHHIKKLQDEEKMPGKFDAKGSGAISDQVDNFLIVFRNKKKERAIEAGESVDSMIPDSYLICHKQRESGWEGCIGLYMDKESMQFMEYPQDRPVNFDAWPHRPWS